MLKVPSINYLNFFYNVGYENGGEKKVLHRLKHTASNNGHIEALTLAGSTSKNVELL